MKRLLFEVHRWAGVALALFMLLWFVSGLVIIYAEPTTPTRAERLAHAESLKVEAGWLSAGEAWERSAEQRRELAGSKKENGAEAKKAAGAGKAGNGAGQIVEARLLLQDGAPLWLIEDGNGQRFVLSALDGGLRQTLPEQALKIATGWVSRDAERSSAAVRFVETIDKPAILRNYELRPYYRIAVDDGAGSELLVSARTGEVVHVSNRIERGFYWAGNWVHLFRPLDLAGLGESRVEVLKWVSFAAVVAALTGLIVGWLRWRPGWFGRKTYSEGRVHPYRNAWFRWHFWGGLIGGVLALAWGLSGFLNNNPWQLFSPANPGKEDLVRYVGDAAAIAKSWRPAAPGRADADVVELVWRRLGDETVQLAHTRDDRRLPQTNSGIDGNFSTASLLAAVQRVAGDAPVTTPTYLHEYDSYYYLRHHRDAAERPLPVVRVDLGDAAGTSYYLDPQDGRLLVKTDHSRRVFRWLYSALHHWDIGWLYQRPLWDAWMLTWVLLGLVLSATAVVIGWKRLALTLRRRPRNVHGEVHPAPEPGQLAAETPAG
ncbi:MAG TPA: PepSY-associated TM helix domain-containing protein [Gallionella sp.]|nr:PepSY-associated TM helix domain-containing protein [Gallionella sp.]